MKYYVKTHEDNMHKVVAIADEDIIGKTFEEGDLCITVSESFYKGKLKGENAVMKSLKCENNLNIVGNHIVGLAIEFRLISGDCILKIQGVAHAQIIR